MTNKTTAAPGAKKAFAEADAIKQTVENAVKTGTEAARASYEQAMQLTKDQAEKASQAFFKGYGDLAVTGKENIEALVQSSTVMVKGAETLGKEWMGFAQAAAEQNVAAIQSLVAVRTLKELVELQNSWAKSLFDNAVAESTKLSEMSVKTANDAFEPIKARVNVTVEKLFKSAAA